MQHLKAFNVTIWFDTSKAARARESSEHWCSAVSFYRDGDLYRFMRGVVKEVKGASIDYCWTSGELVLCAHAVLVVGTRQL